MHLSVLFLSGFAAPALATPLPKSGAELNLVKRAASNETSVQCDKNDGHWLSLTQGPLQMGSAPDEICFHLMNPCAYQKRYPPGMACIDSWDFRLVANSTTIPGLVESKEGKLSSWKPHFTVTPPEHSDTMTWTRDDCTGYFEQLLVKAEPQGCASSAGPGAGNLTIGGSTPQKGTVLSISFVEA